MYSGQAGTNQPTGIAVDPLFIYWADTKQGTVSKMSLGGGSVVTLASGLNAPRDIAIDSNNVYVTESAPAGRLLEIPTVSGTMKVLVPNVYYAANGGVAVDANYVYFTAADNSVRRVLKQ